MPDTRPMNPNARPLRGLSRELTALGSRVAARREHSARLRMEALAALGHLPED